MQKTKPNLPDRTENRIRILKHNMREMPRRPYDTKLNNSSYCLDYIPK
jgi:hypothetical protein